MKMCKDGKYYTFLGEGEKQMPGLKKDFLKYRDFADKTVGEIFGSKLEQSTQFSANDFNTEVFVNDGKGNFRVNLLPREAQVAPVFAMAVKDFDGDGLPDILLGGNFYGVLPYEGRYDASLGTVLLQQKNGRFKSSPNRETGLLLNGEVRDIKMLKGPRGITYFLVARNNEGLECWRLMTGK
jgi:hypothetical protein